MAILAPTADQLAKQVKSTRTDCYRLMVFDGLGTDVLVEEEADTHYLPAVYIPQFTRPAEQITSLLRDKWNIATVLLFSSVYESGAEKRQYAILEACGGSARVPVELRWVPVRKVASHLMDRAEANLLETSVARACHASIGIDPAPFSRLGWIHRIYDWVKLAIQPLGIELAGVQQLNGSETFSLVRFDTTRKPLWFKAVGQPNLHEFPITLTLSTLFPGYLPRVLASDPLLNGWLMESGGESTLNDTEDLDTWMKAVQRLAQLQIESLQHTAQLLQAGCRDLSIKTLRSYVAPFFEAMAILMKQQTKNIPASLTREELSELARAIGDALLLLAEVGIPDTLGHGDLSPGNILMGSDRCVFTDWAEAHVGHPFLTFQYLLAHLRKHCPALAIREKCLKEAYAKCWVPVASSHRIERTFQVSTLLAVYAYAASGNAWRDPSRLAVPEIRAYLRGLTRRMKEQAVSLGSRRES